MTAPAPVISPALTVYRGGLTRPERWKQFRPRRGDIMVCTPAKCGTTWTQTMVAMLLNGGPDLPRRLSQVSPWIDSDLAPEDEVLAGLEAQTGRRVIKTHTPADGFPVWEDVTVVAVYRHPLDVFLSIRKHIANMKNRGDHEMKAPIAEALTTFVNAPFEPDRVDDDCVQSITDHYRHAVLSDRLPRRVILHYVDMKRDGRATVAGLAEALGIAADDALIDRVAEATGFDAMKAKASQYAPEGGKGFWESDSAFFASGGRETWRQVLEGVDLTAYEARMKALLPDAADRDWIENGGPARV